MGVPAMKSEYKIPDGKLVACELMLINGAISEIKFSGDFFMYPEEAIEDLENTLQGTSILNYGTTIRDFFLKEDITLVGISPNNFVTVIKLAVESEKN